MGSRPKPGERTHGAYAVQRLLGTDALDYRTRLGKRVLDLRVGYSVALGFPSWQGMPKPLQAAVDNAIRLQLFVERLFAGFWAGKLPAKRFDTASENLRRQLRDLGLEARAPAVDVAALLASMREKQP